MNKMVKSHETRPLAKKIIATYELKVNGSLGNCIDIEVLIKGREPQSWIGYFSSDEQRLLRPVPGRTHIRLERSMADYSQDWVIDRQRRDNEDSSSPVRQVEYNLIPKGTREGDKIKH